MGVCGYSVPKRNKGNGGTGDLRSPRNMAPGWRQNKGLRGFDPLGANRPLAPRKAPGPLSMVQESN